MTEPQWHIAQLNIGACGGRARRPRRSPSGHRSSPGVDGPGDALVDADFCWPELAAS